MTETDNRDKEKEREKPLGREALEEIESREEEEEIVIASGPRAGSRSGALTFLAFAVVIGAGVHFYLAARGGDSYLNRLDSELLRHAGLSLQSGEDGARMAVAPSWPLTLYETLRNDIAFYAVAVAVAAWLWMASARHRARRDAFLLYNRLNREIGELRARLGALENRADAGRRRDDDKKGYQ